MILLDRKIKDVDANVELLEDRKKYNQLLCYISLFVGVMMVAIGALLVSSPMIVCLGICIFIFTAMYFVSWWGYDILLKIEKLKEK